VERHHEARLRALLRGLQALHGEAGLEEVLSRLVRIGREVLGCSRCAVYFFDEEGRLTSPAAIGVSEAYRQAVAEHSPWPRDISHKPDPLVLPDLLADPQLAPVREAVEREGIRSALFLPLYHEGLLGKLGLYDEEPHRDWTPEEIEGAQLLADQAAVAVARARERDRLRRQNEALRQLPELSKIGDPEELMQRALEIAARAVDADAAVLYEYDARRHELLFRKTLGLPGGLHSLALQDEGGRGLAWEVFSRGRPLFVNDYLRWPRRLEYWAQRGLQAVLGVPLIQGGRRSGALVVGRFRPRPFGFSSREVTLLQLVANQLAAALETKRLQGIHRRAVEIGASLLGASELPRTIRSIVHALREHSPFQVVGALVFRKTRPRDDPDPPDVEEVYIEGLAPEQERRLLRTAEEGKLLPNGAIVRGGRRIGAAYYVTPEDLPDLREVGVALPRSRSGGQGPELPPEVRRWGEHDTLVYFLEVEGRVLGRVTLADPVHGQVPAPEELEPLETLVQLAAWAVQRARSQERLRALYRISDRLAALTSLSQLQEEALDLVREVFDYDYAALLWAEEEAKELRVVAQAGRVSCPYRVGEAIPWGRGVVGWVARTRRPALLPDVEVDPRYLRGDRPMGSELAVPLQIGERLFGVLNLEDRHRSAYTSEDVSLLQALADQLALAISSLERQEELRRSRERLRGIYRLSERLPQTQDVRTLVQYAVETLTEHFAYEHAVIFLREGNELVLQALHTRLETGEIRREAFQRLPLSRGICGRVVRTGEPARVGDVTQDPDYVMAHPDVRSELAVPIRDGRGVLGVINIESTRRHAFTAEDERLLQALARQLAVALRTLYYRRFLEELNRTRDPKEMVHKILRHALMMLPQADAGSVLLFDEERGVYRFWAAIGRDLDQLQRIEHREAELLRILRADRPTLLTRSEQLRHPLIQRMHREVGIPPPGSTISLPISDPTSERVIAFFNVNNLEEEGVFTEEDAQQLWELRDEITAAILRALDRERLRKMALHDALTGVYNRHYLTEYLATERERASRQGYPLTFVMIDLDNFYAVNDRFGHATGDRILQEVAALLKRNVRSHDLIVRYGGDEFLIVMAGASEAEAEAALERLRRQFESWDPGLGDYRISISFGVASWRPGSEESLESVLERADEFMYHRRRKRAEERRKRKRAIIASARAESVEDLPAES